MKRFFIRPRYEQDINILAVLRRKKGLTQEQLAEQANVVPATIVGYEQGHRPTSRNAARLAAALGVEWDELWVMEVAGAS